MRELLPSECHHCDVERRRVRDLLEGRGAEPAAIALAMKEVRCRTHLAAEEEARKREHRRIRDGARRAARRYQ